MAKAAEPTKAGLDLKQMKEPFEVTTDELPPEVGKSKDGDKTIEKAKSADEADDISSVKELKNTASNDDDDSPTSALMEGKIRFTQFNVPYLVRDKADIAQS